MNEWVVIDWLIDWVEDLTDSLIDWLIDRLTRRWLIDWLIDCSLIDWLIDWLVIGFFRLSLSAHEHAVTPHARMLAPGSAGALDGAPGEENTGRTAHDRVGQGLSWSDPLRFSNWKKFRTRFVGSKFEKRERPTDRTEHLTRFLHPLPSLCTLAGWSQTTPDSILARFFSSSWIFTGYALLFSIGFRPKMGTEDVGEDMGDFGGLTG